MLKFTTLVLCICLVGKLGQTIEVNDSSDHLEEFASVNVTQHDNIDDNTETHVHSHKHSKDGSEHNHPHKHIKIAQTEHKLLSNEVILDVIYIEIECSLGSFEKNLISSPFPFGIFRPPIV